MRPEHIVVLVVGVAALLFFAWVTRRPSARAEAKQRLARANGQGVLVVKAKALLENFLAILFLVAVAIGGACAWATGKVGSC